ncbi:MAG: hypothetical protein MHM6MM_008024 [Cercozoa sp. M6MM]
MEYAVLPKLLAMTHAVSSESVSVLGGSDGSLGFQPRRVIHVEAAKRQDSRSSNSTEKTWRIIDTSIRFF